MSIASNAVNAADPVHLIEVADGPSFAQAAGDRILRAARRAAIGFPYECNSGSCGVCRFELLKGSVEVAWLEAPAWSDRDRRKGRYLGCQTSATSDCVIKVLTATVEAALTAPRRLGARLVASRPLTHDMTSIMLATPGAAAFLPGQYAVVSIPGVATGRCYSMANLPNEQGLWEFIVKRVPGGKESGNFVDARLGTEFIVDGPYGHAYFRHEDPSDIACIAGGSGFAPMLSIARAAHASGHRVHFFYGGRRPLDMNCVAELHSLGSFGRTLHLHSAISAPVEREDDAWVGDRGLLPAVLEARLAPGFLKLRFYAAGAPPLMAALEDLLVTRSGVPPDRIHFDRFA